MPNSRLRPDLASRLRAPHRDEPGAELEADERLLLLQWSMTQLRNPAHVNLIALRYEHGWTFAQIATHRGVTESAVHQMHGRILASLRHHLEAAGVARLRDIL